MDETRRVQKVGYSTLTVSIPKEYADRMKLEAGDSLLFKEDADGTLRLIPARKGRQPARATNRAERAGSREGLTKVIVGGYALGYDTIEVVGERLDQATTDGVIGMV